MVACLDWFSRNFDEGMRIQTELAKQNIAIVAIREGIGTTDDRVAANLFRRMMFAQGAYQVKPASERMKACSSRLGPKGERQGAGPRSRPSRCMSVGGCTLGPPRSGVWTAS